MKPKKRLTEATLNSLEYAWPEVLAPRDPWAGDEVRPDESDYENYLAFTAEPEPLDPGAYAAWDRVFLATYRDVLDGRVPWSAIEAPARQLGVWGRARHDLRPLSEAPQVVPDAWLADHVEDWVPDVGLQAPDRVLGPWAEGALPPRVRLAAAAAMAFTSLVNPGVSPAERIARSKPKPKPAYRAALRAIGAAPPMVWEILPGGTLRPLLPLARHARPTGVVSGLPAAPAAIGRAVPSPDGPWLATVLPLPGPPPAAGLARRLLLELLRIRRAERRATWEDVLRRRPEVLYRTALSWAWLTLRDREAWDWPLP